MSEKKFMAPVRKKERLLVILLAIACVMSGLMLLAFPPPERNNLQDLGSIDRAIHQTLSAYGVPADQIRERSIKVDSLFTRTTFQVGINRSFPSTAAHVRIARELKPYGVTVEGERIFPENRLHLTITYSNRLVRSVEFIPESAS